MEREMISEVRATYSSQVKVRVIRRSIVTSEWEGENAVTSSFKNGCASALAGVPLANPDNIAITPSGAPAATQIAVTGAANGSSLTFSGTTTAVTTSGGSTAFSAILSEGETTSAHTEWASTNGTIADMIYPGDTLEISWTFTFSDLTTIGNAIVASRLSDGTPQAQATLVGVATDVNTSTGQIISGQTIAGSSNISASGNIVTGTGSFPSQTNGDGYPGSSHNQGFLYSTQGGAAAVFSITNAAAAAGKRANLSFQVTFT